MAMVALHFAAKGFLGMGQPAPSHQLESLGVRCKLPQRGPGRSPGRQAILPHLKYPGRHHFSRRL